MELSRFERVLLKIEPRSERISGKISKDLGKVKPFDKEPISPKEQFYMYEHISPEVKAQFQQADPLGYAELEKQMEVLRRKYGG